MLLGFFFLQICRVFLYSHLETLIRLLLLLCCFLGFSALLQVLGLEDFPVPKSVVITDVFNDHLDALRRQFPQLQSSTFLIAPECQTGNDSTVLARSALLHAKKTPMHSDLVRIIDDDKTNTGLRTGGPNPIMTKSSLQSIAALIIKEKRLRFHTNMVCVCNRERGVTAQQITKRLVDQLQRYGGEVYRPPNSEKPARIKWKGLGKENGARDDLAMALQLNFAANRIFMTNPTKFGGRTIN